MKLYKAKLKTYKNRYKVYLFTKIFEVPTSLSTESLFPVIYLGANDEKDVYRRIKENFGDRKEIIKIELI